MIPLERVHFHVACVCLEHSCLHFILRVIFVDHLVLRLRCCDEK